MNPNDITGIIVDFSQLPKNYNSSMHPEAVKYRKSLARVSNAIEGVILTDKDKAFMDNIPMDMSDEDFKKAVLARLAERRKEK